MKHKVISEELARAILEATPEYGEAIILDVMDEVDAYIRGFEIGFVGSFLASSVAVIAVGVGCIHVGKKLREKRQAKKTRTA